MHKFFALLNVAQNLYLLQQYCCHIHTEAWKHRQLFLVVTVFSVIHILLTVSSVQLSTFMNTQWHKSSEIVLHI